MESDIDIFCGLYAGCYVMLNGSQPIELTYLIGSENVIQIERLHSIKEVEVGYDIEWQCVSRTGRRTNLNASYLKAIPYEEAMGQRMIHAEQAREFAPVLLEFLESLG